MMMMMMMVMAVMMMMMMMVMMMMMMRDQRKLIFSDRWNLTPAPKQAAAVSLLQKQRQFHWRVSHVVVCWILAACAPRKLNMEPKKEPS